MEQVAGQQVRIRRFSFDCTAELTFPQLVVAAVLPFKRTAQQCMTRYKHSLNPATHRAHWTEEEDALLTRAVQEVGGPNRKWKQIAALIPGRTNVQCRERWVNHLDPAVSKEDWTREVCLNLSSSLCGLLLTDFEGG